MSNMDDPVFSELIRRAVNDFPIMPIDDEGAAHDLTVPAMKLDAVGVPTQVRAHRQDLAAATVLRSDLGLANQQEVSGLHDSVDTLMADRRSAARAHLAVEQRIDAAIAECRTSQDERRDQPHDYRVVDLEMGHAANSVLSISPGRPI